MKTLSQLAPEIIALETPAQADDFIASRVVELREVEGEQRTNEELDALERSKICAWFALHNHHHHARLIELFRPAWPPAKSQISNPKSQLP
jgi:hypothetical protein